ncbi:MAG: MFS transporter [Ignavibacteriaceae bacterium]
MRKWFADYPAEQYIKRNFIINTIDGSVYAFAISFISLTTVMPLFVKKIGGNNIAVALIPVFWTMGFNFTQIFVASYVRKKAYKKPLLLVTALFQRLPWLLLGIFCWFFFENISGDIQLVIFFFCFGLAAVAGGINLPGWFDLVAKLTPVRLRGRLFASRAILGALLGIIGGWISTIILDDYMFPRSFGALFFLAFGVIMISYVALLYIKELKPNPAKEELHYKEFFKRIPSLIKHNSNYRNFLIADALLTASLMADAFFALNAFKKFTLGDVYAGTFTIIIMSSIIIGNILFGFIADKFGHKLNMLMAAISVVAACLLALATPSVLAYYFVFIFSAFTATLMLVSRLSIIAELCEEEDRPTYIAVTNMITAPFILLGIAGGWVANMYGYNIVFILAGFFALVSSFMFGMKVKEPRQPVLSILS